MELILTHPRAIVCAVTGQQQNGGRAMGHRERKNNDTMKQTSLMAEHKGKNN